MVTSLTRLRDPWVLDPHFCSSLCISGTFQNAWQSTSIQWKREGKEEKRERKRNKEGRKREGKQWRKEWREGGKSQFSFESQPWWTLITVQILGPYFWLWRMGIFTATSQAVLRNNTANVTNLDCLAWKGLIKCHFSSPSPTHAIHPKAPGFSFSLCLSQRS